jgi:hypothetical protein
MKEKSLAKASSKKLPLKSNSIKHTLSNNASNKNLTTHDLNALFAKLNLTNVLLNLILFDNSTNYSNEM